MKKQLLGITLLYGSLLFGCQVGQEIEQKPQTEITDSEQAQELDEGILFNAIKEAIKADRGFDIIADTNTWRVEQEEDKNIVNGKFVVNGELYVFEAYSDVNSPYEPKLEYIHDDDFFYPSSSQTGGSSNYSQARPTTVNAEFDFDKAVANIKTAIKAQLKDPGSFKASAGEWNVYQNDTRWVVRGTFTANNSFGAKVTHSFEASFSKTGDQNEVLLLTIV